MAVNSTSRTAMAPMTSFARRESVGTDTGGRMATSGLLLVPGRPGTTPARYGSCPSVLSHLRTTHRTARGSLAVRRSRTASPTGGRNGAAGSTGSARRRGAARPDVGQGGQGVVQGGHLGQRQVRLRCLQRLGAVAGGHEEDLGADVVGGDHLQLDAAD